MLSYARLICVVTSICMVSSQTLSCLSMENLVKVNANYVEDTCTTENNTTFCKSFMEALELPNLSNTCILIEDDQLLSDNRYIYGAHRLIFSGEEQHGTVSCAGTGNHGIYVSDSTDVSFHNLAISSCGGWFNESDLPSSIYITDTEIVTFINVTFADCLGYALVMRNCSNKLKIFQLTVSNTYLISYKQSHRGGGVLLELDDNETTVEITNCSFERIINKAKLHPNQYFGDPFYNIGAGLSVLIRGRNNRITIDTCRFYKNQALLGGGLFVYLFPTASLKQMLIRNVTSIDNYAVMSGGGMHLESKSIIENTVRIENSNFSENIAEFGGGISVKAVNKRLSLQVVEKSSFKGNIGAMGASLYIISTSFFGNNLRVAGSLPYKSMGQAAIYSYDSKLLFGGNIDIEDNRHTAVTLDSSILEIIGNVNFSRNQGNFGGALALFQNSRIFLKENSSFFAGSNFALQRGGGIYVHKMGPETTQVQMSWLLHHQCFFYIHVSVSPVFYNNTSDRNRLSDIYAHTLLYCRKENLTRFSKNIFTNPVKLEISESEWKNVIPGFKFWATVLLLDELNNSVSRDVEVNYGDVIDSYTIVDNRIYVKLLKTQQKNKNGVSVIFKYLKRTIVAEFQSCPYGFMLTGRKCICNSSNIFEGIICHSNGTVSLLQNRYADPEASSTQICPNGYCKKPDSFAHLFNANNPDSQCQYGRTGYLCSLCPSNTTLEFFGNGCIPNEKCSLAKSWIIFIFAFFVVILVVVVVATLLQISIYETWLNSLVYFYQVVYFHALQKDEVITWLVDIASFSGFDDYSWDICLFTGWNDMHKNMFNIVIPIAMLIIVCLIVYSDKIHRLHRYLQQCAMHRNDNVHMYKIVQLFLIFAYTDITRIILTMFNPVSYSTSDVRVYIYAEESYLSPTHVIYLIVCAVLFVTVVLFIPCVLATRFCCFGDRFQAYVTPLNNHFEAVFKDELAGFSSFYYFARLLMICTSFPDQFVLTVTLSTVVSTILFVVFVSCFPYKEAWTNLYDTFVLGLLVMIGILDADIVGQPLNQKVKCIKRCIHVFYYLPLAIAFVRWLYLAYHGCHACKRRRNLTFDQEEDDREHIINDL